MNEFDVLESDSVVDVDKVKKNLNFDETKRTEDEKEEKIPDEMLSLPPSQKSNEVEAKLESEDDVQLKSDFKEPEIWQQSQNECKNQKEL